MDKEYKIVVVDDDATNLSIVYKALIDKYDVYTVPSAEKLFSLLERITPNLILLDILMPVVDGFEALKRLKSSENPIDIPVILLTAVSDPQKIKSCIAAGALDCIAKPFTKDALVRRIDMFFRNEA